MPWEQGDVQETELPFLLLCTFKIKTLSPQYNETIGCYADVNSSGAPSISLSRGVYDGVTQTERPFSALHYLTRVTYESVSHTA